MGRRIVTKEKQKAGAAPSVDTYFDKLIKYIPADIVAAWTAVTGLIAGMAQNTQSTLLWITFVVGALLAAAWTWRQTSESNKPPATTQIIISTVAFIIWVFALGGPFETLSWYSPTYGSLLLIGFTLTVPLVDPQEG